MNAQLPDYPFCHSYILEVASHIALIKEARLF